MPLIKLEVDSGSTVGDTSDEAEFVGHMQMSVAETTENQNWDGVISLEQKIDGDWIETETFDDHGVWPGFNALKGTYRLKLKTKQMQGSAKAIVNGFDNPPYVPF